MEKVVCLFFQRVSGVSATNTGLRVFVFNPKNLDLESMVRKRGCIGTDYVLVSVTEDVTGIMPTRECPIANMRDRRKL